MKLNTKHNNISIIMHIVITSMKKTQRFMPTIIYNLESPPILCGIMDTISHPPVEPLNPKEAKTMCELPKPRTLC